MLAKKNEGKDRMNKAVAAIAAVLAMLTCQGMSQETHALKTEAAAPVATKFDRMEKAQLRAELQKLQKDVLVAEQTARQADAKRLEAYQAYKAATENQKPDALIRMLEADAKSIKPVECLRQLQSDFEAAKRACLNLLVSEQK